MMDSSNYDRLIIDGNNFIYRAYHAHKSPVMVGVLNTTPIYQFCMMLKNMVNMFHPKEIVLTWDKKLNVGGTNFRKQLVSYKEQRAETDTTVQIFKYIDYIQALTDAMGVITLYPVNFEADDIISFISRIDAKSNLIVSADKDLLQLIDGHNSVYVPSKQKVITEANFIEEVGIAKECFVLYKAILGDVSDNIPGLPRYGNVKAKRLAEQLILEAKSDIKTIYDYIIRNSEWPEFGLTTEYMNILSRNIQIMDLTFNNAEISYEYDSYQEQFNLLKDRGFNHADFKTLCNKYNFFSFIRDMGNWRKLFDKDYGNIEESDILSRICI